MTAYEGFGIKSCVVNEIDFYGVRRARLADGLLTVECGYLQPKMPQAGQVTVILPSRDVAGQSGRLILTLTVSAWKMNLDTGEYPHSTTFSYCATLDSGGDDLLADDVVIETPSAAPSSTIEFEDEHGSRVKVIDL